MTIFVWILLVHVYETHIALSGLAVVELTFINGLGPVRSDLGHL